MTDCDRIRAQVKRMRSKGVEPEYIEMSYEIWDGLGRPRLFCGVYCYPDGKIKGFEVR